MTEAILVITSFPNKESAQVFAQALIDRKLAACVNVMPACTSVYRWQDNIETAEETPVFIKTRSARYQSVEELILSMHPYELPEVITVPISEGLPAYLRWIIEETT
ncbi:divalent-cation tolerance protein CutA [Nitrosomonas marina]|uniref:Divalent cation tolerance protein n=1 Tax=Nitrosomonas marina TaxID=917 RepID=A0A1H8FYD4_9PROT|nr:divalent-cation tolerance protein CutA [Nitrosomonas marina]SEN36535.1 divalent cation tolerance protein [Nitrosomonas marina]